MPGVFCPQYTGISIFQSINFKNNIYYGAQNVSSLKSGAHTGEVSLTMLQELGCKFIIIGHSERRELLNENYDLIKAKFNLILTSSVTPIVCIGENKIERNNGQTEEILKKQLNSIFQDVDIKNKDIIIAYEPIWAIGTGVAATNEIIYNTHKYIKNIIKNFKLKHCNIYLIYGGSVNENNAEEILQLNYVDGFLIGSASTKPDVFNKICLKFKGE